MGSARRAPSRIINTPDGQRERTRMAGELMRRRQTISKSPIRKEPPIDRDESKRLSREKIMERRKERIESRTERREERKQMFGDDFRRERKEVRPDRIRRRSAFINAFKSRPTDRLPGIRQVNKIDRDTGRRYGGKEIFNPATGDYEKQYNEPNIAKQDI